MRKLVEAHADGYQAIRYWRCPADICPFEEMIQSLELSMIHPLHFLHNHLYNLVLALGVIRLFEVAAEEKGNSLVKTRRKTAFIVFDDIITVVAGLAIDELH